MSARHAGPEPPSFYFAEHLARIASISLLIYTPAPHLFAPAFLQFPREGSAHLWLRYATSRAELRIELPAPFAPALANTRMDLVARDLGRISVSIKAADQKLVVEKRELESGRRTGKLFADDGEKAQVPLSHEVMGKGGSLECSHCGTAILQDTSSITWKPLPSESWAEMMDFWHCHKPAKDHDHDQFNKAYTVSKFVPQPHIFAFVGLSYLLLSPKDLQNIQNVNCARCDAPLGEQDTDASLKLYKWNLNPGGCKIDPFYYVSAQIAELIAAHGVYTFSIVLEDTKEDAMLLWVVNSNVEYTCTIGMSSSERRRAFRVLYTTSDMAELAKSRGDIEQVYVPRHVLASLERHLAQGTAMLQPQHLQQQTVSAKWSSSVLDKYNVK